MPPPPRKFLGDLKLLLNRNSSSFPFQKGLVILLFCLFLGDCSKKSDLDSSSSNNSILGDKLNGTISAGAFHTCAILNDNTVKCWGDNDSGQIGGGIQNDRGTLTLVGTKGSPLGSDKIKHIAAGGEPWSYQQFSYTCAILNNNTVKCWGDNQNGRTGGGNPLRSSTAKYISAGGGHTCAILSDNTVKCWGDNDSGQIGGRFGIRTYGNPDLTLKGTRGNPLGSDRVKHISSGISYTCAILSDDTVKCWGANGSGQTGGGIQNRDGDLILSGTKGSPLDSDKAKDIAAGASHTCAILSDDTVKCWGSSYFEQAGIIGNQGTPLGSDKAKDIVAGASHNCAILSDDTVKCWGNNRSGQTGGGTQNYSNTQVLSGTQGSPLGSDKAKHIAAGSRHTCAILGDDTVKCWGDNEYGQADNTGAVSGSSILVDVWWKGWNKHRCRFSNARC